MAANIAEAPWTVLCSSGPASALFHSRILSSVHTRRRQDQMQQTRHVFTLHLRPCFLSLAFPSTSEKAEKQSNLPQALELAAAVSPRRRPIQFSPPCCKQSCRNWERMNPKQRRKILLHENKFPQGNSELISELDYLCHSPQNPLSASVDLWFFLWCW